MQHACSTSHARTHTGRQDRASESAEDPEPSLNECLVNPTPHNIPCLSKLYICIAVASVKEMGQSLQQAVALSSIVDTLIFETCVEAIFLCNAMQTLIHQKLPFKEHLEDNC
eukprot:843556-Pelagomonas_calceolata.AAC.1